MAQDNSNSTMEMGTSDQVLVANKGSQKLKYGLGFVVMLAAIAVVVTLVVVLSGNEGGVADQIVSTTEGPTTPISTTTTTTTTTTEAPTTLPSTTVGPETDPQIPLDLEEIIEGAFSPPSFNGTWTSGSDLLFRNANGDLVLLDTDTDSLMVLISNTSQILQQASRVPQISPDESQVVLAYNVAPVYRYSYLARYASVDVVSGNVTNIIPPGLDSEAAFLQNFVWGPSGTSLAFVYLNNIYYQPTLTSEPQQITSTGQLNVIYNGIPDWVYEEEVFSSSNAIWFSRDGSKMAYVTFNDEDVRMMRIPHYGVPGSLNYQYTQHRELRYPKAGTTNPTVTVSLRDLDSGNTTVFTAPTDLEQPILKPVTFVNNETIALMWTDRVQTTLSVLLCTQTCNQIFTYTEPNGWIDNVPLIFNDDGTAFITLLPQAVNGVLYKQIVQVSQTAANTWTSQNIVNTAHTVLEILLWAPDGVIWYKATSVDDSAEQHIYSVSSTGVSCFTCNIRRDDGRECLYNEATISTSGAKITINCAGPDVPQVFIYDTNGTRVAVWEESAELNAITTNRLMPTTIRLSVPIGVGLADADVHLQVPADYQNRTERLPLLVFVYAGPDTALVTKQWNLDWGSSLVSRWGIAVAQIDGRGTGLRGVSNLFAVNRRLGTYEVDDQVTVTRYLQDNLSYIDGNRTCIWGWSYGGYAATKALAEGGSVFRCAAAIAPVVDWRFYDTIYTERYMDVPTNNTEGYAMSSLLTDQVVESFRNKSYFMIHGSADDNVHYQHAMLLSRLLQRQDVYFTQMSYTDEDHSLSGVRPHVYHALEKFLQDHML